MKALRAQVFQAILHVVLAVVVVGAGIVALIIPIMNLAGRHEVLRQFELIGRVIIQIPLLALTALAASLVRPLREVFLVKVDELSLELF